MKGTARNRRFPSCVMCTRMGTIFRKVIGGKTFYPLCTVHVKLYDRKLIASL